MTAVDGDLLDKLQEMLRGRSRSDAITSAELSERLDLDDGEASPKAREAIRILREERNVPVRAGNVGYWICQSEQEAQEYLDDLRGRIGGIEETMDNFQSAWDAWERSQPLRADGSGDDIDIPDEVREQIEDDPVLTIDDWVQERGGEA